MSVLPLYHLYMSCLLYTSIEEVNAPYGYTLNKNYYEVNVDSNTAHQMDGTSGDVIIDIAYENHPVKGELNTEQTQMTFDETRNSWFPHISPDGKSVVFITYYKGDLEPGEHHRRSQYPYAHSYTDSPPSCSFLWYHPRSRKNRYYG